MVSKFKEVWHTWNGKGEPPANVTGVIFRNGSYSDFASCFRWNHTNFRWDIIAYTTGETRQRVECFACNGEYEAWTVDKNGNCDNCNGRNYVWEYLK